MSDVVKKNELSHALDFVQKLSFGYNAKGDALDGTCTAVALGQVLNYLDRTFDNSIVGEDLRAEELTGNRWSSTAYAKTHALQKLLVLDLRLAPIRLFGRIAIGTFGPKVPGALKRYFLFKSSSSAQGACAGDSAPSAIVKARLAFCLFGRPRSRWAQVSRDIDAGVPAMITTYPGRRVYSSHTMFVAGYRELSDGSQEYLVHNGWYSSNSFDQSAVHTLEYISAKRVALIYRFSIEGQ